MTTPLRSLTPDRRQSARPQPAPPSRRAVYRQRDVGDVAHEPQRHPDGAGALPIDTEPEVIDGQVGFVLRLAEAGGQLGAGQAR